MSEKWKMHNDIKSTISDLLKRANLGDEGFDVVPGPIFDEGLYYEIHGNEYIYGYHERGNYEILCKTNDANEFYYQILNKIIFNYAVDYELKNRIWYISSRRISMAKELEWMKNISLEYYTKLKKEYDKRLEINPFDDNAYIELGAIDRYRKLLRQIKLPKSLSQDIRSIRSDLKTLRDILNDQENHGVPDYTNYFKIMTQDVSNLYERMKQAEINIPDNVKSDLEFTLEKAKSIINYTDTRIYAKRRIKKHG